MYPSLIFADREYSPDWFKLQSGRLAAGLVAAGLKDGDSVAVMLRNDPAYVALMLACRQAGLYLVSINWHFKADETGWILSDSGSRALFIHDDLIEQVRGGIPATVTVVGVSARPDAGPGPEAGPAAGPARGPVARPDTPAQPTALAAGIDIDWRMFGVDAPPLPDGPRTPRGPMTYTSGTTGKPKGVRRLPPSPEHRAALERGAREISNRVFGIDASSTALLCAPIYHSAPMSYLMHCCLVGARVVLEPGFDARHALDLIARHQVTHAYLVPTMFQRLVRLPAEVKQAYDLSSIRQVASTGSPCPAELKHQMIDWWGPVITEAYASSETGYLTFIDSPTWLARPGSAGRPIGDAELRILDDNGAPVPAGQSGLIYARQPAYPDFTYQNNDRARSSIDREGLVTLGDVGYLDDDGYLFVNDRKSDMVISGGVNIYPAEIEACLHTMPGVADNAVFGIPDDEFGEALAAAVQTHPGVVLSSEDVQRYLRERLANYKVPRVVSFHSALPREDTGKIFKKPLRAPYWDKARRSI